MATTGKHSVGANGVGGMMIFADKRTTVTKTPSSYVPPASFAKVPATKAEDKNAR